MLRDMVLTNEQATSVVRLLCNNDVKDKPRHDMIAAWEEYMNLEAFTNDVVPILNNGTIDTSRRVARVRFYSALLECLPLSKCTNELSYALASTEIKVQEMDIVDNMLLVANVDTNAPFKDKLQREEIPNGVAVKGTTKRMTASVTNLTLVAKKSKRDRSRQLVLAQ
jgi:hypothetical protein